MKQWSNLIKYRLHMYLSSSKFIVPTLVFMAFTYIQYQIKPCIFINDAKVSSIMTGYIMMWITFSFLDSEDVVAESILYCNIKQNKRKYYGSKLLTLFFISIIFSLFGAVYPCVINAANDFSFFTKPLTVGDIVGSFLLHMILGVMFLSVSYLFQPRAIRDRKAAIILLLLVAAITISKSPMVADCPILKYILWVFPPVNNIMDVLYGCEYFTVLNMVTSFLYGAGYSVILLTIGSILVNRKDF